MDIKYEGPISFPNHLEPQAEVIDDWLASIEVSFDKRKRVLLCLNNDHLRALPRLAKARAWPRDPKPKNWRFAFYGNVSKILGWQQREKFPAVVEDAIRKIWPDKDADAVGEPSGCNIANGGSGADIANPLPSTTTAGVATEGVCRSAGAREPRGGPSLTNSEREGSTPTPGESTILPCLAARVELHSVSTTGPQLQRAAANAQSPGSKGRQPSLANTSSSDSGSSAGSTGRSKRRKRNVAKKQSEDIMWANKTGHLEWKGKKSQTSSLEERGHEQGHG